MSTNIKLLPFHPQLVKLFPSMTAIEFEELVADIDKNGQRVEIDTWNGQIIDGKHRALACQRLGVPPKYRERRFESEIGARDYVVSQNFHRRHLTPEDKRALIAAFADWSKSDRAIAADLKTSKNTIARVRKAEEKKRAATGPGGPVEKKRTGKDGKVRKQPAVKKAAGKPKQPESKGEPKKTGVVEVEVRVLSDSELRLMFAGMSDDTRRRALAILKDLVEPEVEATPTPPPVEVEPVAETSCGTNPFVPPAPAADDYPDMPEFLRRAPQEVAEPQEVVGHDGYR
jgi:hypothetical protein